MTETKKINLINQFLPNILINNQQEVCVSIKEIEMSLCYRNFEYNIVMQFWKKEVC